MMTQLDLTSRQGKPLKLRIIRHDKGVFAGILRTLENARAQGRVKPGADAKTAATVLAVMWLGLVRAKVDHGPEVDLPKAITMGFEMAIAGLSPATTDCRLPTPDVGSPKSRSPKVP